MDLHKDMEFATYDVDSSYNRNCAVNHKGGWWYRSCFDANFNGQYGDPWDTGICIRDRNTKEKECDISRTAMAMKPMDFDSTGHGIL